MKLPRWLMIAMLTTSVLLPLAVAGWWWVTWPERTARDFVDHLKNGRYEEERQMLRGDPKWTSPKITLERQQRDWTTIELIPEQRTLSDILLGCRSFKFSRHGARSQSGRGITSVSSDFRVEQGKLVGVPEETHF